MSGRQRNALPKTLAGAVRPINLCAGCRLMLEEKSWYSAEPFSTPSSARGERGNAGWADPLTRALSPGG